MLPAMPIHGVCAKPGTCVEVPVFTARCAKVETSHVIFGSRAPIEGPISPKPNTEMLPWSASPGAKKTGKGRVNRKTTRVFRPCLVVYTWGGLEHLEASPVAGCTRRCLAWDNLPLNTCYVPKCHMHVSCTLCMCTYLIWCMYVQLYTTLAFTATGRK